MQLQVELQLPLNLETPSSSLTLLPSAALVWAEAKEIQPAAAVIA